MKTITYLNNIQTTNKETVKGFLEQSERRVQEQLNFWNSVRETLNKLTNKKSIDEVINNMDNDPIVEDVVFSISGFSKKSIETIKSKNGSKEIKKNIIDLFKNNENIDKESLMALYLLTKGDSIGGTLRNLVGSSAEQKFLETFKKKLPKNFKVLKSQTNKFVESKDLKNEKFSAIQWDNRLLLFNMKPKMISKNIDMILLSLDKEITTRKEISEVLENANNYLACGELKGGIDPAGADEHWKTARTSLYRIKKIFKEKKLNINTFFIASAIESHMSEEIVDMVKNQELTHVANLNKKNQVKTIVDWLFSL